MLEDRSFLASRVFSSSFHQENQWPCFNLTYRLEVGMANGKRPSDHDGEDFVKTSSSYGRNVRPRSSRDHHPNDESDSGDSSDSGSLISSIGRDNSINCLIRCSRSDYGSIASLNRSFRKLIRNGELYKLRRLNGVIEHWVYFSCHLLEWEAFDPIQRRWMHLPRMDSNECFMCSDKESLGVGTDLLVFGKDLNSHVTYRYSILTNSWCPGVSMNDPRCLFGSASKGEIAILAGGCDSNGNILNTAELYNSETKTWVTLPNMIKPRKLCSGVFMDKKFYVIGGVGGSEANVLTCGEEYDLETRKWTEIPNMSPGRSPAARDTEMPAAAEAPPLLAVVNNELYAADHTDMEVRKYDKQRREWNTVGRLPERAVSTNGWGLAFRACGDRLIVIGGPRAMGEGYIELNSWVPSEGPPRWDLLARKPSANFVYNCAVMGC
ncbi:F-box/kelch-repeat protein SKIP11 [Cucumis melo]|uniref:F-box/kelch-repeat protein SKIP11 n=1 Tax=Cucumis melo TaxID=3656 RepID=A0A1S4E5C8_CUCME|nr:F-box/kelch-repeat protein SKIP11 [Cucumis melo]XP_050947110.1 F-box/kelch-repeat protein SKIP11 [Cucumis melo]XP_050947111.1 F-box/kelch-repeat protein SKIP11 [Cucumis melo]XP_050947112.1 F-box/kelch-repeat protein SKIP11 [Cucumis melo]